MAGGSSRWPLPRAERAAKAGYSVAVLLQESPRHGKATLQSPRARPSAAAGFDFNEGNVNG